MHYYHLNLLRPLTTKKPSLETGGLKVYPMKTTFL